MIEPFILHWSVIQKILINTLLVSIPEEIYLVMFTLILIGEFDYWMEEECKKLINPWDYSRILIPTIPVALLLNIARYTGMNMNLASPVCLILFYVLIVLTNDILNDARPLKWMGKAFFSLIIAQFTVGISEFIYFPFVLYHSGKTITQVNSDMLYNFLLSLPSRLIQYTILIYMISRKRTLLKGKLAKQIILSPILSIIFLIIVMFNLLYLFIMYNAIVYENDLANISSLMQFLIIIGVVIFPFLNILGLTWAVYYVKNREMVDKKNARDKLDNLLNDMKIYTNIGKYDNIKWKMHEIGVAIKEVAESLYTTDMTNRKGGSQ